MADTSKLKVIKAIESHLDQTAWGRGVYTEFRAVPGARPAQIRAGAKKLYDVFHARIRHTAAKQAVRG